MDKDLIIQKTVQFAKDTLSGEGSGHDRWHIYRVWKMALRICETEKADVFVVQLAALLHDIADWKFHGGDESKGPQKARERLQSLQVSDEIIDHVCSIIEHISYKGAGVASKISTTEGMIVQDADRLDTMGAIGIARTIAYGGYVKREIYNPEVAPVLHQSAEEYKKNNSSSINHFYEKLLLLKDRMNTQTAKKIAERRHQYMEKYLEEFFDEREGKK